MFLWLSTRSPKFKRFSSFSWRYMVKQLKTPTGPSVLIVEDSKDFSDLLKFVLEDDGFVGVQFPVEGEDVVAWAREQKPVAILMDLALRHQDGRAYIDLLKADPVTKKIPIIVITGRDLSHKEILELKVMDVKYMRKGRVEMDEIRSEVKLAARKATGRPAGSPGPKS